MEENSTQNNGTMRRDSFIFYTSWLEGIDAYTPQEQAEIIFALVRYCAYGIEPDLTIPHVKMAYLFNKPSIDKNHRKYLNRIGKTKEKQNNNEEETKREQNENKTRTNKKQKNIKREQNGKSDVQRSGVYDDVDVDVDVDDDVYEDTNVSINGAKTQKRFAPPSIEQVKAYMSEYIEEKARKEKRYLTIDDDDPERFVKHHEKGDWILKNGKKMKSWKAAVVTWILNHNKWTPDHLEERKHTLVQDDTDYGRFNGWLLREVPYVAGHFEYLLNEHQFSALKRAYGTEKLMDTLYDLENRHDWCDKCSDLNTTLINWLKKDDDKQ